ncbi:hypothetical protein [Gracilimonas mengyeensis]|uniref:Long-chain fatty acid transport protein n=1 Tax=Gracilimonas mengyeensis TaxID=1302730 RepID=A0A521CWF3_9BACT|nr:hypothetical protein [Gracilimonas mengyeensis]SMO63774.1 hypothetical protein SAMN06265219_106164 [Gracilimonas mengyeensis]
MKRLRALLFLTVFTVASLLGTTMLHAQTEEASKSNSGSFYSLFGVGYPSQSNNARELGLSIIGVSLDNTQSNTLQNPALWGNNSFTTASSGFHLSRYESEDPFTSSTNANLGANYFQFTFPVLRQKLGISASMYSVTRSNYRYFQSDSLASPNSDYINYVSDLRGDGGINKLEIGFGWKINRNFSIGYAPSFAFISQNNSEDVYFDRSAYGTSSLNSSITGGTFSQRFGALASFSKIASERDRMSIGASVNLPFTIDAQREVTSSKIVNQVEQDVAVSEKESGDIKFPVEINAGLTYYPSSLVNISLEGQFQQWSEYESDFDTDNASIMMTDRQKLGLGVEYHPYRSSSSSFFSNFRYSLGSSFDSGHLTIENEDISTLWLSAGLGLVSGRSRSTVDISARYGIRGTTTNNLISERIWSLNLSVNLSELMFFRPKFN